MPYGFITDRLFMIIYKDFLDFRKIQIIWNPACKIKWSCNLHFPLQLLIFAGKKNVLSTARSTWKWRRWWFKSDIGQQKCDNWFDEKGNISKHDLENIQALGSHVPERDHKRKTPGAVFLPHSCDPGQCFQLLCCCSLSVNKGLMCTLNFK